MARLRYNGLAADLAAPLGTADTTITFDAALTHSGGTAVPTISGGDIIPLALLDSAGELREIVHLTAYTTGATTGTISRAQESTVATTHATTGRAINAFTKADAAGFVQSIVAGSNVTVDASDPANPVIGTEAAGLFRGAWSNADTLLHQEAFGTTGTPPAEFVLGSASGGTNPVVEAAQSYSGLTDGGAGTTNALRFYVTRSSASQSHATLDLSTLGVAGATKIKFKSGIGFDGYNDHQFEFRVNGVAQLTVTARHDWTERTVTVDDNDTVQWFYRGTQATAETLNAKLRIADVRVYGPPPTYDSGEFVAHKGRLWQSNSDGNVSEPGVSGWTEVPTGYDQALTTGGRPTGIAVGARVFDTTLGKPVWWNGTGWVDATGTTA